MVGRSSARQREGDYLQTKPPTHRTRDNMAVGIAIVVLVALLVLLWEFHGLIYQYFSQ